MRSNRVHLLPASLSILCSNQTERVRPKLLVGFMHIGARLAIAKVSHHTVDKYTNEPNY